MSKVPKYCIVRWVKYKSCVQDKQFSETDRGSDINESENTVM